MHNHTAIEHAIAVTYHEIGIEQTISRDEIVGAMNEGIDAVCDFRLLICLDFYTFITTLEGCAANFDESFTAGEIGLLEGFSESLVTGFGSDTSQFIIQGFVPKVEGEAEFQEWRFLTKELVISFRIIIFLEEGIVCAGRSDDDEGIADRGDGADGDACIEGNDCLLVFSIGIVPTYNWTVAGKVHSYEMLVAATLVYVEQFGISFIKCVNLVRERCASDDGRAQCAIMQL